MISYARLTDRLDGGTPFSATQILLPNAASWLLMAASAVPLTWALRKRVSVPENPCNTMRGNVVQVHRRLLIYCRTMHSRHKDVKAAVAACHMVSRGRHMREASIASKAASIVTGVVNRKTPALRAGPAEGGVPRRRRPVAAVVGGGPRGGACAGQRGRGNAAPH